MAIMETSTVQNAALGTQLATYHWVASSPRAVVHINHGLAEHARRYDGFAQRLNAAGFAVFAQDHRGHGATRATDAPQGAFSLTGDGVARVLADISMVQDHIRTQHADVPLIMFGHSMGGLITMNYALAHPDRLAGAAVWNSNFSAGLLGRLAQLILRIERFRLGSDVPSRMLPKLTFEDWAKKVPDAKTGFDWLSHKPDEVKKYIDDPLCGWDGTVSLWEDIFRLVFAGGQLSSAPQAAKELPFHLLGGGEDPATNMAKAVTAHAAHMKRVGFGNVTLRVFDTARHETLNDVDADAATQAFIDWVDSVVLPVRP